MPTLIFLKLQIYQTPESVIMNHRVHYFPGLDTIFILFLPHQSSVIDYSWLLAMDHIYKNNKPHLYEHKKIAQNLPGLLIIR